MMQMHKHIRSIQEASALDKDRMTAPKELWWDSDALEEWFESRRQKSDTQSDSI